MSCWWGKDIEAGEIPGQVRNRDSFRVVESYGGAVPGMDLPVPERACLQVLLAGFH